MWCAQARGTGGNGAGKDAMTPKEIADHLIQNRKSQRTRRGNPCPVCGHSDGHCLRMDDDSAALCPKTDGAGSVRRYGEYGFLYVLSSGLLEQPLMLNPVKQRRERTHAELHALWAPRAKQWWRDSGAATGRLAGILGVAEWSLNELKVGWDGKAWTFPERNADGLIIGVNRRFEDGHKRCATGSRRGLTFSDTWSEGEGPVLIVEGGSDVAAGLTMGMAAIGRPNNTGGVAMLQKLLAGCDRHIIVIGERDRKPDKIHPDTMRWPGMDGVKRVASQLSKKGMRVGGRLLPGTAKDLRAWFLASGMNRCDREECFALGRELSRLLGH